MSIFYVIFGVCVLAVFMVIGIFVYQTDKRSTITGVITILSSATIILGLVDYIKNENTKYEQLYAEKAKNYVNFVSNSFDKIDSYYLENPTELHDLFYEFYGYNNFPKNKKDTQTSYLNNITNIEYIILLKIIQQLNIMFITNDHIFEDVNFRNKIINYTRSQKFKKVLSYNKNSFSAEFINRLDKLKIINAEDIQVEHVVIPTL